MEKKRNRYNRKVAGRKVKGEEKKIVGRRIRRKDEKRG